MKICNFEGCEKEHCAKGYCDKHYRRLRRHGLVHVGIKDNEYRFQGNDCFISIFNNKGEFLFETVIDKEDFYKVHYYKWCNDKGYTRNLKHRLLLHNLVMDFKPVFNKIEIDHKDRDKTNNRKSNLRICTRIQNQYNVDLQKNNKSGYKGISKIRQKWRVRINDGYIQKHLGYFTNIKSAVEAYNMAAIKYYGEFAVLNILD